MHWLMYVAGYRDAQVGWVEVSEDAAALNKTTTELRHTLFLVIYAPRRGLLEVQLILTAVARDVIIYCN